MRSSEPIFIGVCLFGCHETSPSSSLLRSRNSTTGGRRIVREKGRNGDCQNRSGNESRGMGRSLSHSLSYSLCLSWFCLIDSCVFLVFKQLGLCRLFVVFFFFFFTQAYFSTSAHTCLTWMWPRIMLPCSLASLQRPVYNSSCPAFELCLWSQM